MPVTKEITIRMDDRPGVFGKVCRSLADRGVNILAFQSIPYEGKSLARLVVDNPGTAKTALDGQNVTFGETDVALVSLPHRPGELARAAARLGENKINIEYSYSGMEAKNNAPILIFGVAAREVSRAVELLEETAAAAGR